MIKKLLIILILISQSVFANWAQGIPLVEEMVDDFHKWRGLSKINSYIEDKNYNAAEKEIQKVITKYPKEHSLYSQVSQMAYEQNEFTKAYEYALLAEQNTNDRKLKAQYIYNQAVIFTKNLKRIGEDKKKAANKKFLYSQLINARSSFKDALMISKESPIKDKAKSNISVINDYLRLLKEEIQSDINLGANQKSLKLNDKVTSCLKPLLSLDEISTQNLELLLAFDSFGEKANDSMKSLENPINCQYANSKTIHSFGIIAHISDDDSNYTKKKEELENYLQNLEDEFDLSNDKISSLYRFIHALKLLADNELEYSGKLHKNGKDFASQEVYENAIDNYITPLIDIINHFFPALNHRRRSTGSLLEKYPKLLNNAYSTLEARTNEDLKIDSINQLDNKLRGIAVELPSSSSLNLELDINLKSEGKTERSYSHDLAKVKLHALSSKVLEDSLSMIKSLQAKAYHLCKDQSLTPDEFVKVEFESMIGENLSLVEVKNISGSVDEQVGDSGNRNKTFKTQYREASLKIAEQINKLARKNKTMTISKIKGKELKKRSDVVEKVENSKKSIKLQVSNAIINDYLNNQIAEVLNSLESVERNALIDKLESAKNDLSNITAVLIENTDLTAQSMLGHKSFQTEPLAMMRLIKALSKNNNLFGDELFTTLLTYSFKKSNQQYIEGLNKDTDFWIDVQEIFEKESLKKNTIGHYDLTREMLTAKLEQATTIQKDQTTPSLIESINNLGDVKATELSNELTDNFSKKVSAGSFEDYREEDNRTLIALDGTQYLPVVYQSIDNRIRKDINEYYVKDKIKDPNAISSIAYKIPKDGHLFTIGHYPVKSVVLHETNTDITNEFLAALEPKTGRYNLKKYRGQTIAIENYIVSEMNQEAMNLFDSNIQQKYTAINNCSVDLALRPSLEKLVLKLKNEYGTEPKGVNKLIVSNAIANWLRDNVYYSKSSETGRMYRKFHRQSNATDSVYDFMLKINRGDCDVHNGFVGCVLNKEFNIPVRLANGYYAKDGVINTSSAHGWLQIWSKRKGGWIDFDSTGMKTLTEELQSSEEVDKYVEEVTDKRKKNIFLAAKCLEKKAKDSFERTRSFQYLMKPIKYSEFNDFIKEECGLDEHFYDRKTAGNYNVYQILKYAHFKLPIELKLKNQYINWIFDKLSEDNLRDDKALKELSLKLFSTTREYYALSEDQKKGIQKNIHLFDDNVPFENMIHILVDDIIDADGVTVRQEFKVSQEQFDEFSNHFFDRDLSQELTLGDSYSSDYYIDKTQMMVKNTLAYMQTAKLNKLKNKKITLYPFLRKQIRALYSHLFENPSLNSEKFAHTLKEMSQTFSWEVFEKEARIFYAKSSDKLEDFFKENRDLEHLIQISKYLTTSDIIKYFNIILENLQGDEPLIVQFLSEPAVNDNVKRQLYNTIFDLSKRELKDLKDKIDLFAKNRPAQGELWEYFQQIINIKLLEMNSTKSERLASIDDYLYFSGLNGGDPKNYLETIDVDTRYTNTGGSSDVSILSGSNWGIDPENERVSKIFHEINTSFLANKHHNRKLGIKFNWQGGVHSQQFLNKLGKPYGDIAEKDNDPNLPMYTNVQQSMLDGGLETYGSIEFPGGKFNVYSRKGRHSYSLLLANILSLRGEQRKTYMNKLLDSVVFASAPTYFLDALAHLAEYSEDKLLVSDISIDVFKALERHNILETIVSNKASNGKFQDQDSLMSLYLASEHKEEISKILKKYSIKFDLTSDIESKENSAELAFETLGPFMPRLMQDRYLQFGFTADNDTREYINDINYELLKLETLSGARSKSFKNRVLNLGSYLSSHFYDFRTQQKVVPKNVDLRKLYEQSIFNNREVNNIKEEYLADTNGGYNGSQQLTPEVMNLSYFSVFSESWNRTLEILALDKELEQEKILEVSSEYIYSTIDYFNGLKDEDYEKLKPQLGKHLLSFEKMIKLMGPEDKAGISIVLFNKLYDPNNKKAIDEFLLMQIETLFNGLDQKTGAEILSEVLANKKIISNPNRHYLLTKLAHQDEFYHYLDNRKVADHQNDSLDILNVTIDQVFMRYPKYRELTSHYEESMNLLLPKGLKVQSIKLPQKSEGEQEKIMIAKDKDFVVSPRLQSAIGLRRNKGVNIESELREKFGMRVNDKFQQKFNFQDQLDLASQAIGNGLYSPMLLSVFPESVLSQLILSERSRKKINDNLLIGFFHHSLKVHFGEKWHDKETNELININQLYYDFSKLSQKEKLEYLQTNSLPYNESELKRFNKELKKIGFEIKIPTSDKYQWENLDRSY